MNKYLKYYKQLIVNLFKKITPLFLRLFFRKLNWRRIYLQKTIFRNYNNNVYCPIAEKAFKIFPDGITPVNGARPRHRLFWLYVMNETDILSASYRILHIAPQYGIKNRFKKYDNLEYIPGDKKMPGYDYQKDVINVDLLNIGFKDNTFDYLICNRVLEHIEDDHKAMSEIYRVLKNEGKALLSVPIDKKLTATHESYTSAIDRIKHYGQWDHVRMYAMDIKNRLEITGFTVKMIQYDERFSEEEIKKFGIIPDIIIEAQKIINK